MLFINFYFKKTFLVLTFLFFSQQIYSQQAEDFFERHYSRNGYHNLSDNDSDTVRATISIEYLKLLLGEQAKYNLLKKSGIIGTSSSIYIFSNKINEKKIIESLKPHIKNYKITNLIAKRTVVMLKNPYTKAICVFTVFAELGNILIDWNEINSENHDYSPLLTAIENQEVVDKEIVQQNNNKKIDKYFNIKKILIIIIGITGMIIYLILYKKGILN